MSLKELRQSRAIHRACATKLINKAQERNDDTKLSELNAIVTQLTTKQKLLADIDASILSVIDIDLIDDDTLSPEVESEINEAEERQLLILTTISELNSFISGIRGDTSRILGSTNSISSPTNDKECLISKQRCRAIQTIRKIENEVNRNKFNSSLDLESLSKLLQRTEDVTNELNCLNERFLDNITSKGIDEDELDKELEEIDSYKERSQNLISELRITIKSLESHKNKGYRSTRLPEIQLPRFDGNPMKFKAFWEAFNATIDKHDDLEPCVKLTHLLSLLDNDAKAAFEGTIPTNELYKDVRERMIERFGREQLVTLSHLRSLFHLPPATNALKLKTMYNSFLMHVRYLNNIHVEDWKELIFISLLLDKLPPEVESGVTRQQGNSDWQLKELGDLIEIEIKAAERPKSMIERPQQRSGGHSTKATAVIASGNRPNMKVTKRCTYCSTNGHYSEDCPQIKHADARKEFLNSHRLCFTCLGSGHTVKFCRKQRSCKHCNASHHHPSICYAKYGRQRNNGEVVSQVQTDSTNQVVHENVLLASDEEIFMPSAWIDIKNQSSSTIVSARSIIDTGSHRTKITESKARELGLKPVDHVTLQIGTFGTDTFQSFRVPVVEMSLIGRQGEMIETKAHVFRVLTGRIARPGLSGNKYPILKQCHLADPPQSRSEEIAIDVIIGSNLINKVYTSNSTVILDQSLGLAIRDSIFGWIISGPTKEEDESKSTTNAALLTIENPITFYSHPESFWNLESIGITESPTRNDKDDAIDQFNSNIKYADGRYHVRFPWRMDSPELPLNYELAKGRLRSLWNRLDKDELLRKTYDDVIRSQELKGVIEEVPDSMTFQGSNIHYLPHHGVRKDHSTTKLRIVYDASAKTNKRNTSLNDALYPGPLLLCDMTGILLRFRMSPIAVISDIEKAFLSIGLQMPDRDAARFLWVKDNTKPPSDQNLRTYRFTRIPFGTIASPFLLSATISHHLRHSNSTIADEIQNSIYVDNVVIAKQSTPDALKFYHDAKEIFDKAGMNIREWTSNSKEFTESINPEDRAKGDTVKVLGLQWNTTNDKLHIPQVDLKIASAITKRALLHATATLFDPLGLFSPITMRGKLLFRESNERSSNWDEPLPLELRRQWDSLIIDLSAISTLEIPRYISQEDFDTIELHCFCDASGQSYAACAYIRIAKNESVSTSLILSKNRLAPSKKITIPRLELLGVIIGTRIMNYLIAQLPYSFNRYCIWTDSQCVIHWINSKKLRSVFVENRLKEIRRLDKAEFRYVHTTDNPADLPTRGMAFPELKESTLWWQGPKWLKRDEKNWPQHTIDKVNPAHDEIEERKQASTKSSVLTSHSRTYPFDLNPEKFVSLGECLRRTAIKQRTENKITEENTPLTAQELESARMLWISSAQNSDMKETLDALKHNRTNQEIQKLKLFVDDEGIARSMGRIDNSSLPYDAKFPIILPKNHPFTNMIIKSYHEDCGHSGTNHTLADIRQRYWLIAGRKQVQAIITKCQICKKWEGKPYSPPEFPVLPTERVSKCRPFSTVGIDHFGPFYVHSNSNDQEENEKVWVCIFTCASTRAIHLELASDLSALEFLNCFTKFISRRGTPSLIISDNAKNFKLGHQVISNLWRDMAIQEYAAENRITWKFITEKSPWMGGFYERLIRTVKMALRKLSDGSLLTQRQLDVLLSEIEGILNNRPLTYVGSDMRDALPLTPRNLLGIQPDSAIPPICLDESDPIFEAYDRRDTRQNLIKLWRHGEALLHQFWTRWQREYLLSLRERPSNHETVRRSVCNSVPTIGDRVIIMDRNIPRGRWRCGQIINTIPSKDGRIRSARISLENGSILTRPIKLLVPLEFANREISTTSPTRTGTDVTYADKTSRPQRKSAARATDQIRQLSLGGMSRGEENQGETRDS